MTAVRELSASSMSQSATINQLTEQLRANTAQLNSVSAELRKVMVALRTIDAPTKTQTLTEHKYKLLPLSSYADLLDRVEMVDDLMKLGKKTPLKK